jgi:L-fucose/D-arabinose isomerase
MARVGILSFSDGRPYVHADVVDAVRTAQRRLTAVLERGGHEVVGGEAIDANDVATREARKIAAVAPDLTIFNFAVWAFPHFAMLAANATDGPLLLHCCMDPAYPGMVGMLAAGGALDQIGRRHERSWGAPEEPATLARLDGAVRAARAVGSLRGATFGRIGGRPMGMYTAVADSAQWMRQFGVDVEEIDQLELVRRAEEVPAPEVASARGWLERTVAGVHYDGHRLTPELLERQLRAYYAMRALIDEGKLDFTGIKAQPELTAHFATMDIAEAFLNDPYDWDGPKPVHVCSTEADMDGALTMRVLGALSGTPALFADVRHYHAEHDVWDLCNSGQHATWFSARSEVPEENLAHVHLHPADFYFPAGGASVHHLAAPGDFTFARFTRLDGRYRLHALTGKLVRFDDATNEALMRQSTYTWPHAFARLDAPPKDLLGAYGCNHIHAVPGDHVEALRAVCRMLDVDFVRLGAPR